MRRAEPMVLHTAHVTLLRSLRVSMSTGQLEPMPDSVGRKSLGSNTDEVFRQAPFPRRALSMPVGRVAVLKPLASHQWDAVAYREVF